MLAYSDFLSCTTMVHNTTQNSSANLPPHPPDKYGRFK